MADEDTVDKLSAIGDTAPADLLVLYSSTAVTYGLLLCNAW